MRSIAEIVEFLEQYAPPVLAESWDNVGLLTGDRQRPARRVMTCLTITPASAAEAIGQRADLIVSHHPLPFRALKRLTTDTPEGRLLWDLTTAGISIFSPHTAFDSAADGINQRLAASLGLADIRPLVPSTDSATPATGAGRTGRLTPSLALVELAEIAKTALDLSLVQVVGDWSQQIEQVAVACGSAGEFLTPAREAGCQVLVTGETRFHTCLEAEATGMSLVLLGHYASERFGVEHLAQVLTAAFRDVTTWASTTETDPLRWV